jgi:glutamine amidotransferase
VLDGVRDGADLYFVHSYVAAPAEPLTVVADTTHGTTFPSVIAHEALTGVQFHPERSGTDGLRILANVVRLADAHGRPGIADPGLAPLGAG